MQTPRLPQPVHDEDGTPSAPGDLELVRGFLSCTTTSERTPDSLPPSLESLRWWLASGR